MVTFLFFNKVHATALMWVFLSLLRKRLRPNCLASSFRACSVTSLMAGLFSHTSIMAVEDINVNPGKGEKTP